MTAAVTLSMFAGLVLTVTVSEATGSRDEAVNDEVAPYESPSFWRIRSPIREASVLPPKMKLPIRSAG